MLELLGELTAIGLLVRALGIVDLGSAIELAAILAIGIVGVYVISRQRTSSGAVTFSGCMAATR